MSLHNLLYNKKHRLRTLWRILIFISAFLIGISPLLLVNNSLIQFLGAVIVLVCGLYLNSRYLDKIDFSAYGLVFKKGTVIYLFVGILIGLLSVVIIFYLGLLTDVLEVAKTGSVLNVSTLAPFALKMFLVSIFEETFFRGYLYTTLYDGLKSKKRTKNQSLLMALIIASLCFGLAHIGTSNASVLSIINLSINGLVWCIPFIITRNLGLSIGMHTAWNFTQTTIGFTMSGNKAINSFYRIKSSGPDWFTGGEYGPEAGILGLVGFMIMLTLALAYLSLNRKS